MHTAQKRLFFLLYHNYRNLSRIFLFFFKGQGGELEISNIISYELAKRNVTESVTGENTVKAYKHGNIIENNFVYIDKIKA